MVNWSVKVKFSDSTVSIQSQTLSAFVVVSLSINQQELIEKSHHLKDSFSRSCVSMFQSAEDYEILSYNTELIMELKGKWKRYKKWRPIWCQLCTTGKISNSHTSFSLIIFLKRKLLSLNDQIKSYSLSHRFLHFSTVINNRTRNSNVGRPIKS
jgi:hypothetical protein